MRDGAMVTPAPVRSWPVRSSSVKKNKNNTTKAGDSGGFEERPHTGIPSAGVIIHSFYCVGKYTLFLYAWERKNRQRDKRAAIEADDGGCDSVSMGFILTENAIAYSVTGQKVPEDSDRAGRIPIDIPASNRVMRLDDVI